MPLLALLSQPHAVPRTSVTWVRTARRPLAQNSRLALLPGSLACAGFYAAVAWTFLISLTTSRLLPNWQFSGTGEYRHLIESDHWKVSVHNLLLCGTASLLVCLLGGYLLAVSLDRGMRGGRIYLPLLLAPLSVSFVVSGVIWQWLLSPAGIQATLRHLGWVGFVCDWLYRSDRAIYVVASVTIWQHIGLCAALFLSAMRRLGPDLWHVSRLDGIPTWRFYSNVVAPQVQATAIAAVLLLLSAAIKTFDLVTALTGGGPGFSSDLPARFVVELIDRQELAESAAGACVIFLTVAAIAAPFVYRHLRRVPE